MSINPYSEKLIRKQIIKKLNPDIRKGRSAHDKAAIMIDGVLYTSVKLPKAHAKEMLHSKSSKIAAALQLDEEQFQNLIDCPLSGSDYHKLAAERMNA